MIRARFRVFRRPVYQGMGVWLNWWSVLDRWRPENGMYNSPSWGDALQFVDAQLRYEHECRLRGAR